MNQQQVIFGLLALIVLVGRSSANPQLGGVLDVVTGRAPTTPVSAGSGDTTGTGGTQGVIQNTVDGLTTLNGSSKIADGLEGLIDGILGGNAGTGTNPPNGGMTGGNPGGAGTGGGGMTGGGTGGTGNGGGSSTMCASQQRIINILGQKIREQLQQIATLERLTRQCQPRHRNNPHRRQGSQHGSGSNNGGRRPHQQYSGYD